MKQNTMIKFLNASNSGWAGIQKYFDANQEDREFLLSKVDKTGTSLNFSLFELLNDELNSFSSSIEIESNFNNSISEEKNRRHQAYTAFNYFLSGKTYFDYFSLDVFLILQNSKILMKQYQKKNLTSDIFLLSFYSINSDLINILKEFDISPENIQKYLIIGEKNNNSVIKNKYFQSVNLFFKKKKKIILDKFELTINFFINYMYGSLDSEKVEENTESLKYSKEMFKIFSKSISSALRYKTPIITPELLFLTFLEQDNLTGGKIVKKLLKSPIKLSLLRYRLLKLIHQNESNLRSLVIKNQHFFAYLLKAELSDMEFQKLIKTNRLDKAVNMYRNDLICSVMGLDLSNILEKELILRSRLNTKRKYSV